MTTMRIGWAVRSKHSGSLDDYRIIGHGGTAFSTDDLAAIFTRLSLGTPGNDAETAASLPWIGLGQVRDAQQRYHLGITVHDWLDESDSTGRRILRSRYYYAPYDSFAEHGLSYADFYRIATEPDLPEAGAEFEAEVPPAAVGVARAAASIGRFGFDRIAAVAALALVGQVTVTQGPMLSAADRLDFLDAVTALLPYGWRTRLSAGTCYENGSKHIGVCLARRRRTGAGAEVRWSEPTDPAACPEVARRYLELLHDYVGRRAEPVAALIGHLAAHRDPLAGADPAEAVRILADFGLPGTVLLEFRSGRGEISGLRSLFASRRHREIRDPQDRRFLLHQLILHDDPADEKLIGEVWQDAGGDVVRLATESTAAQEPAVARVIVNVLGIDSPEIVRALAARPRLVAHLLDQSVQSPPKKRRALLEVLGSAVPEAILKPFVAVMPMGEIQALPTPDDLDRLAGERDGDECVRLLVGTALRSRTLDTLALPLISWLRGREARLDRARWRAAMEALRPEHRSDQGLLDALVLWLGGGCAHLAESVPRGRDPYLEAFQWTCGQLGMDYAGKGTIAGLVSSLEGWDWNGGGRSVKDLLAVIEIFGHHEPLDRVLVAARFQAPRLGRGHAYSAWRREALMRFPHLEKEELMAAFSGLRANPDAASAARLCAESLHGGSSVDQVCELLARAGWRPDGGLLLRFVEETVTALVQTYKWGRLNAERAALQLVRRISGYSPHARQNLGQAVAGEALERIRFLSSVVHYVSADFEDDRVIRMSEVDRQKAEDVSDLLNDLAKRAKSRKRR